MFVGGFKESSIPNNDFDVTRAEHKSILLSENVVQVAFRIIVIVSTIVSSMSIAYTFSARSA